MSHQLPARHGFHMARSSPRRPDIVPRDRLPFLVASEPPTMVRRSEETTAQQTCGPNDTTGRCERYNSTSNAATLPIVLGVVIPIACAIVLLIILHQRHLRKLRSEDANDKHKSLDFGMDDVETSGPRRNMEEKKPSHRKGGKGLSLDMISPYLLPPGLHGSRDSLHSLSRSIAGDDDKYRTATSLFHGDNASVRSHSQAPHDDASSFTGSPRRHAAPDDMNQGLLQNAQRMSRSSPPRYNPHSADSGPQSPASPDQEHGGLQLNLPRALSPNFLATGQAGGADQRSSQTSRANPPATDVRRESPSPDTSPDTSNHSDPAKIEVVVSDHSKNSDSALQDPLPSSVHEQTATQTNLGLPQQASSVPPIQTPRISLPMSDGASDYGDDRKSGPMIPAVNVNGVEDGAVHDQGVSHPSTPPPRQSAYGIKGGPNTNRLTFGLRPLPPEDSSEDPEQRANRIRSFYKEYFDQSKPGNDEYREEYYGDDAIFDPVTGEPHGIPPRPFAEPINRRAMTPPPRAPPRFQGPARHMPTNSAGSGFDLPSPRVFSSASGRYPGAARGPRKPMPPPAPLQILPTPHMLKDDFYMQSIDFAPGINFKDQREGRPETPTGGLRPFTPMTPIHNPLASAFDELSAIPSPHALRKSGTYTNLDFAPPPRFKRDDTASDAGSIHSNRTGISATHLHNIRTGAYRVSRLPTDTVGTKDDIYANLRPKWDMRS